LVFLAFLADFFTDFFALFFLVDFLAAFAFGDAAADFIDVLPALGDFVTEEAAAFGIGDALSATAATGNAIDNKAATATTFLFIHTSVDKA
jgi:hypothetical protein